MEQIIHFKIRLTIYFQYILSAERSFLNCIKYNSLIFTSTKTGKIFLFSKTRIKPDWEMLDSFLIYYCGFQTLIAFKLSQLSI